MVKVKQTKVAFMHPDLGIGGAERLVLDVAVALADQGVQVEFHTNHFDKNHAFAEVKDGKIPVKVYGDWLPRGILGLFQALCAYFRMVYLACVFVFFLIFEKDKPDLYFVDQIPIAIPVLKYTGKKIIYYCHHPDLLASPPGGVLKRLYRKPIDWLEMWGTKCADIILVNSEYTKSVFRQTFPQITQDIKILYPTIAASFQRDIEQARCRPLQEVAPVIQETDASDVVFLSINRYHPAKSLELVILAMAKLKEIIQNDQWKLVHLVMAGGFDPQNKTNKLYFNKLVELTHHKELVVKVSFLKSPNDKQKAELLKSCDCLIYTPSNEHFGIVPLEAMCASKPVIAVNSGGPRETVEEGKTGYLSEPTPEDLAANMAKMLNRQRAYTMGLNGKERLEKLFSHKNFCDAVMNITMEALEIPMN